MADAKRRRKAFWDNYAPMCPRCKKRPRLKLGPDASDRFASYCRPCIKANLARLKAAGRLAKACRSGDNYLSKLAVRPTKGKS